MHCRKCGLDIVTSATNQYQLWFGAGLFLKDFSLILIIAFQIIISTGQTFFKTPTCGNAKRCTPYYLTTQTWTNFGHFLANFH